MANLTNPDLIDDTKAIPAEEVTEPLNDNYEEYEEEEEEEAEPIKWQELLSPEARLNEDAQKFSTVDELLEENQALKKYIENYKLSDMSEEDKVAVMQSLPAHLQGIPESPDQYELSLSPETLSYYEEQIGDNETVDMLLKEFHELGFNNQQASYAMERFIGYHQETQASKEAITQQMHDIVDAKKAEGYALLQKMWGQDLEEKSAKANVTFTKHLPTLFQTSSENLIQYIEDHGLTNNPILGVMAAELYDKYTEKPLNGFSNTYHPQEATVLYHSLLNDPEQKRLRASNNRFHPSYSQAVNALAQAAVASGQNKKAVG